MNDIVSVDSLEAYFPTGIPNIYIVQLSSPSSGSGALRWNLLPDLTAIVVFVDILKFKKKPSNQQEVIHGNILHLN